MDPKSEDKLFKRVFVLFGTFFLLSGFTAAVQYFLLKPSVIISKGKILAVKRKIVKYEDYSNTPAGAVKPKISTRIDHYTVIENIYKDKKYESMAVALDNSDKTRIGSFVTIYFDPDHPDTVETEKNSWVKKRLTKRILIPAAFTFIGLFFIIFSIFTNVGDRKKQRAIIEEMQAYSAIAKKQFFSSMSSDGSLGHVIKLHGFYLLGVILTVIGLLLSASLYPQAINIFTSPQTTNPLLLPPFLLGLGLLALGYSQFFTIKISVKGGLLSYEKKYLLGEIKWREPLSAYLGITKNKLVITHAGSLKEYMQYYMLIHPDPEKSNINIAEVAEKDALQFEKQLIASLHLPLLEEGAGAEETPYIRSPEDIDKNITDLLREGKIKRSFLSELPLESKYLKLKQDNKDDFSVYTSAAAALKIGILLLIAGPVMAFQFKSAVILIPFLVMGLIIILISLTKTSLTVSDDMVIYRFYYAGKIQKEIKIPLHEISNLRLGSDSLQNQATSLFIASDSKKIYFGQGERENALRWLEDKILELLSPPDRYSS